jgi:VWFA-related protein
MLRLALSIALVAAAATQSPSSPAPGNPSSSSDVVRIDVIATDARGRAVENLKAADFELREDGALQALDEVRFVKTGAADARLFAIYLDDYYVSASSTARVRDALHRFVDRDLGPNDLVTILRPLDSLLTIRLTRDRESLHRAIDAFEGRRGDYAPRTAFERNYMVNEQARADVQRTQATWSTLNALALHLANLGPGRKTMLLVSEQADPMLRRRGFEALPTSSSVMRTANRSNVSIYVLDPLEASRRAAAADEGPNLLQVLTDDTNGALFTPSTGAASSEGGIDAGLQQMAADASAYYLLTYRSIRNTDGLFHSVDVKVKPRGIRLRARKGYWAPTTDEIQRANLLAHANDPRPAVPLPPARHISPLIRPWFGVARGANGQTRVTFVWEPAGAVPGDRRIRTPSRVELKALRTDGTTVFDGPVRPTGATVDVYNDSDARAVFEVPPGRVRLQMSIEDSASQPIDTDVREILVGDLRAPVAIGTPQVLRARTARDVRALDANPDAVPVSSREFSRAERLVIRVPAYAPGTDTPTVSARLLTGAGQSMRTIALDAEAIPDGRAQIDLPLAGLASGEYAVEITAASPAGEAKDTLHFRVTN